MSACNLSAFQYKFELHWHGFVLSAVAALLFAVAAVGFIVCVVTLNSCTQDLLRDQMLLIVY
jgi:hypothetical protein